MKNLLLIALVIAGTAITTKAQDKVAPSPAATVSQTVGLTDFTVEYSRPGMKDREVFGELVPYGKKWRAGANSATKFTCSTAVNIGGAALPAGEYALLITPEKDKWTLHFYPYDGSRWSPYAEGEVKPIDATTAEFTEMPWDVESFTILFGNLRDETATLHFIWERMNAVVPVMVPPAKK